MQRHAPASLLVLLSACCAAPTKAPPPATPPDPAPTAEREAQRVRVLALRHAECQHLSASLSQLLGRGRPQSEAPVIMPDPRTNSLIVRASAEDMAAIESLVRVLDQRVQPPSAASGG